MRGKHYLGCYSDRYQGLEDANDRRLPVFLDYVQSHAECQRRAWEAGYRVFGVQFGRECYAGMSVERAESAGLLAESQCSAQCASTELCGAGWVSSVYTTTTDEGRRLPCIIAHVYLYPFECKWVSTPTHSPAMSVISTISATVVSWINADPAGDVYDPTHYIGCFQWSSADKPLQVYLGDAIALWDCQRAAYAHGFSLFGLTGGYLGHCYAGVSPARVALRGARPGGCGLELGSSCKMRGERCGDGSGVALYSSIVDEGTCTIAAVLQRTFSEGIKGIV